MNKSERMQALVEQLNSASYAYYTLGEPVMSDKLWDDLYNELSSLERETGEQLPNSPTRMVGSQPLSGFAEHTHITRLWSMDKAQNEGELAQWFARAERLRAQDADLPALSYIVEYKLDGLTLNLTYQDGQLIQAATRGNGVTGEAILPQAMTVQGVPRFIPYRGLLEVQGECIMRLSSLEAYNKTAETPLKNARNAAAGALRNLDPQVTASRRLSIICYEIGTIENPPYTTQQGMLDFLRAQGFPTGDCEKTAHSMQEALAIIRDIEAKRDTLDYLIDGAVVKITDLATRARFGYTDKFPRWAVAYKFEAEENTTVLESVTWEPGRTGKLTPLAHVSAVDFAGVTVKKATLNNYGDITRKRLAIGKTVWIRRSNDVIPEIMGCVSDDEPGTVIEKPTVCPACGEALVERGAHLYCINRETCRPQAVARLSHFASRDAMDIESFSEKTAGLLYDKLGVRDPADLYHLRREQLEGLEGFKEKRIDNLFAALEKSKHCALDAFLLAVGVPNVGKRTARDLAMQYQTLDNVRSADIASLQSIRDIGDIVAQSVADFFSYPENNVMIDRLLQAGVAPQWNEAPSAGGALAGMSVVVTGRLETLSRADAEALIASNGGTPSASVSKKTALLVCGEDAGSKLQKAQTLGVRIISEQEFLDMLKA